METWGADQHPTVYKTPPPPAPTGIHAHDYLPPMSSAKGETVLVTPHTSSAGLGAAAQSSEGRLSAASAVGTCVEWQHADPVGLPCPVFTVLSA